MSGYDRDEFDWFTKPPDCEETVLLEIVQDTAPIKKIDPNKVIIIAMVAAHNEEEDIRNTVTSLLNQTRPFDEIVIISDNSTDRTVEIASEYPVTVIETVGNTHRKSGAMNLGWRERASHCDILVCADGDTMLPPHAAADWEKEFWYKPQLAGSSSQPIMTGSSFLSRLQRYEFSKSVTQSLSRGWCRVVSGTGCAFRGSALRMITKRFPTQDGPWTYQSVVEDYHLTYQLRHAGWKCEMSPTVYCHTGSMKTVKSLWHQRIKWQAGTVGDLLVFGCNKLNWREWMQQGFLLLNLAFWLLWISLNGTELTLTGHIHMNWYWQSLAVLFAAMEYSHVRRMPEHDWKDIIYACGLIWMSVYNVLSMAWGLYSWRKALSGKMGDLWAPQYRAEGMKAEAMKIGVDA